MENKQIFKALAAINKGIQAIGKTNKNTQQNFMFRGIDDVMNELHDLFAENEVVIIPEVQNIERESLQTKSGGNMIMTLLTVKFNFYANDGSMLSVQVIGEAMDSGDKSTNKAMSVALKYALLQMFLIPTKEEKDPDANSHQIQPKKQAEPAKKTNPVKIELIEGSENYKKVIAYLKTGGHIDQVLLKYNISESTINNLNDAIK